jgi:pSer/pThr/pTyr-binding forkhead associated (FHA) protein
MQAQREIVRFLSACQGLWQEHFPQLVQRAQAHIVSHLGHRARDGAAVGELYGLVKQVFLLDDSTVKERILAIHRLGLCSLDPPGEALSTRTLVVPAEALLERFDRYLKAVGERLLAAAAGLDPTLQPAPLPVPDAALRGLILRALEAYQEPWRAALEAHFDARGLSRARRLDAVRHLIGTSHWTLLHMAIEHRYGLLDVAEGQESILADHLAAALLRTANQNFQTTRDHIGYLIEFGLLERHKGKALRVALAEEAAPHFDRALLAAAAELPDLARSLAGSARIAADVPTRQVERPEEQTWRLRAPPPRALYHLTIVAPPTASRQLPIAAASLTIGRVAPCDLVLEGAEISRRHCRIEVAGERICITDLNSTNGTFVDGKRIEGTVELPEGATLQIGAYVIAYERLAPTLRQDIESTLRPAARSLAAGPAQPGEAGTGEAGTGKAGTGKAEMGEVGSGADAEMAWPQARNKRGKSAK